MIGESESYLAIIIFSFNFNNFILDNITSGNPYLKRTKITNCDLRYEFYPGDNQIISLKNITQLV